MYFASFISTNFPVAIRFAGMLPVRKSLGRPMMPAYAQHTRTSAEQSVSTSFVTLLTSKPTFDASVYSVFR